MISDIVISNNLLMFHFMGFWLLLVLQKLLYILASPSLLWNSSYLRGCILSYACMLSCVRIFETPRNCNPPGSSLRGIFQARILERVATSYSRVEPASLACPALAGGFFTAVPPEKHLLSAKHCMMVSFYVSPWLGT